MMFNLKFKNFILILTISIPISIDFVHSARLFTQNNNNNNNADNSKSKFQFSQRPTMKKYVTDIIWDNAYYKPVKWKLRQKNIPITYYINQNQRQKQNSSTESTESDSEFYEYPSPYEEVLATLKTAFNLWSQTAKINFQLVNQNQAAEIVISFESRRHDCSKNLDGKGGALGHAYPPGMRGFYGNLDGDIHFDIEEPWTFKVRALKYMKENDYEQWVSYMNGRQPEQSTSMGRYDLEYQARNQQSAKASTTSASSSKTKINEESVKNIIRQPTTTSPKTNQNQSAKETETDY